MTNNERITLLENLRSRPLTPDEREAIDFALDLLKKHAVREWLKANDRWANEEYGR